MREGKGKMRGRKGCCEEGREGWREGESMIRKERERRRKKWEGRRG